VIRSVVFLLIWIWMAVCLRKWSLQQDQTDDPGPSLKARALSGPGVVAYTLLGTFAYIDWVMSLESHWYSTIFAVIIIIGQILVAFSFSVVLLALLGDHEPFAAILTRTHFHHLGNLLLAFVMFWTYVSFGQLLIVYSGDIPEARASFADATRLYQETRLNIPTDLLTSFVFNSVYLDRDAASARRFWNLYESKSPTHFGVDYWLSRSALHWIENHPLEARDAFATGSALADQLPHAGAYDFDRDRYRGMKELLDGPPVPSADDQTEILSEAHAES